MSKIVAAVLVLALGASGPLAAQEQMAGVEQIARQVASADSRRETLLQLAAVLHGRQRMSDGELLEFADSVAQDRAWLERVELRYGAAAPGAPVLDPAAWVIRQSFVRQSGAESGQTGLPRLELDRLLRATFQRGDERLAAAILPELLWRLETEATTAWHSLQTDAAADEALRTALARAMPASEDVTAVEVPSESVPAPVDRLTRITNDAVNAGPPDRSRLERLRYQVLIGVPEKEDPDRFTEVAFLRLGNLVDSLHEGQFTTFAEGLLAVAGELLEAEPDAAAPVAAWLAENLPRISASYARAFSEVDPRLNSAVAASYDVARNLPAAASVSTLGDEVADAVAQLALLMPDIEYYFGLPIRDTIGGTVDACIGLMAQTDEEGRPAMSRELFDDCMDSLMRMAEGETRSPALSGDLQGPFGADQLQREVSVTPVQRINYALGYLGQRYPGACALPAGPLPNPLEWSSLATLMAWFAQQMPVYFQTPQNEARLAAMRRMGSELSAGLAAAAECYSGPNGGDIVSRSLADYQASLNRLSRSLREGVAAYRQNILAPGADIALEGDALQETLYRPEKLDIVPCDAANVCEMSATLSADRALVGLFPEPYLIADQSGLGEVQLCYENMEWVDRRSEPVRPDDDNVANYFGRFAFDLKGRLVTPDGARDVFGFRFTSPDEYHYLFAAAKQEVLDDACPVEWVGSRIVTSLPNGRAGIVPNRLTYLAAPRMLPSRLLEQNWEKGAEWRDWFATGLGVQPLQIAAQADIVPRVSEHLHTLYLREQSTMYAAMLESVGPQGEVPSRAHLDELSTQKGLIRMLMVLLYPQSVVGRDDIRGAIAGQGGLLDGDIIERFRSLDMPVNRIGEQGLLRLEAFRTAWRRQAEATLGSGSMASGVAHAVMRLDQVHWDYFRPPAPLPAAPPTPVPSDAGSVPGEAEPGLSDSEPPVSGGG